MNTSTAHHNSHYSAGNHTTIDLSLQMDDILLNIFQMLNLADIQRLRLVNKRLNALTNSKVVWINVLRQLDLPLPPESFPLSARSQSQLMQLATRSVRLDANWRQPRPSPSSIRTVSVDAVVMSMTMCSGMLFSAHKDGFVRCWHDLGATDGSMGVECLDRNGREDFSRSVLITPPTRIVRFSLLEACEDPHRGGFIVAYVGDGIDRRTYCGVSHVPPPVEGRFRAKPSIVGQYEVGRGAASLAVSPTSVVMAKLTDDTISVIDLVTHESHMVEAASKGCGPGAKIMKAHILAGGNAILLLTSSQVSVYPMPSRDRPHVSTPVFQSAIPLCASLSIGQSSNSPSGVNSTALYGVTEDGYVVRYTVSTQSRTGTAISSDAAEVPWAFSLQGGARERFPYPVERLSVTDVVGGSKKAVWVHWRRGTDGWPVHLMGSSEEAPALELTNVDLALSRPPRSLSMFRSLNSSPSSSRQQQQPPPHFSSPSPVSTADISNFIRSCTRDYSSMPRICFDEGIGRMVISGISSPQIAVCEFA